MTPARVVLLASIAAMVVFAVVQDRIVAAAAGQYAVRQQAAESGVGPAVTIDEVMRPAVHRSVRIGALSGLATFGAGVGAAAVVARRRRQRR